MRHFVLRGEPALDLLNLFLADAQTGFGAFLAVYLTAHKWTPVEVGLALSIGTVTGIVSQIPAGLLVDRLQNKRVAVAGGIAAIALAALLFVFLPYQLPVAVAEVLHGFASCVLTPAVAAVSLRLVGQTRLGERLGRNARFAAIGNGTAAGLMGALGTYVSTQSVFLLTAALAAPAAFALWRIGPPADPAMATAASARPRQQQDWRGALDLLTDRRLLVFFGCILMFHLANAAMLPIAASSVTAHVGASASLVIAVCIMLPQAVVAVISPWLGRQANRTGRRTVLLIGWTALPVRAALFALLPIPGMIAGAQVLDGVSAAVFGVMLPLIAADVTRGKDRFNLCIGIFGLAVGIGATLSTSLAGWVASLAGERLAFAALAGAGMAGLALLAAAMPETGPPHQPEGRLSFAKPPSWVGQVPARSIAVRAGRPRLQARRRQGYARAVHGGAGWRSRT